MTTEAIDRDLFRDRARGALLGLALGDALGTTLEFQPRDANPPLTGLVGGGPFGLAPGEWTDDTSLALCLAESLLEGWDPADQARRYVRWWREGHNSVTGSCFDIGITTRTALSRFERTGDPFSGDTGERSAGNGSLMRLAPVPIRYAFRPELLEGRAADSSRVTHGAVEAVDACRYAAHLMGEMLRGAGRFELLASRRYPAAPRIEAIAAGDWCQMERDDVRSSGYVVHTFEAALWSIGRSESWHEGALLAANLADDADTVAAVYGQLAGALAGESGLPADWLARLAWRERITELADGLADLALEDL